MSKSGGGAIALLAPTGSEGPDRFIPPTRKHLTLKKRWHHAPLDSSRVIHTALGASVTNATVALLGVKGYNFGCGVFKYAPT